jgi:hypothetical protein
MKTLETFDFNAWLKTAEPGEPPVRVAKKSDAKSDIKRALSYFKVESKNRSPAQIARDLWDALKDPSLSERWAIRQDMYQLGVKAAKHYENRSLVTNGTKLPYVEERIPTVTFTHRTSKHSVVTYVVKLVDGVVSFKVQGDFGKPWFSVMEELKHKDKKYKEFRTALRKAMKQLDALYKSMGK